MGLKEEFEHYSKILKSYNDRPWYVRFYRWLGFKDQYYKSVCPENTFIFGAMAGIKVIEKRVLDENSNVVDVRMDLMGEWQDYLSEVMGKPITVKKPRERLAQSNLLGMIRNHAESKLNLEEITR